MTEYRTSSFCSGGDCIAVGYHKSSFSYGIGECVEVGHFAGDVRVRDTKDRSRPELVFTPDEWAAFVAEVKRGGFSPDA